MRATTCGLAFFLLAGYVPVLAQAPPPPTLTLSFEPTAVVVTGVTPGGTAYLLGAAREVGADDYPTTRLYQEALEDTDANGVVRLELEHALPSYTVFAAVDGATGRKASATTASFGLRLTSWVGAGPSLNDLGLARVADSRSFGLLLVVRPGGGAWTDVVIDGSEEEGDGLADGGVDALLDDFTPAESSPLPPDGFLAGDVVALLDPTTFELVLDTLSEGVAP